MSDVTRYDVCQHEGDWAYMEPCSDGDWVSTESYQALSSENEKLRDTLRQFLAERDAQIASMRAEVTPFIETHWMPVARQRDKLAHLCKCALGYNISSALRTQIDAALAEVK